MNAPNLESVLAIILIKCRARSAGRFKDRLARGFLGTAWTLNESADYSKRQRVIPTTLAICAGYFDFILICQASSTWAATQFILEVLRSDGLPQGLGEFVLDTQTTIGMNTDQNRLVLTSGEGTRPWSMDFSLQVVRKSKEVWKDLMAYYSKHPTELRKINRRLFEEMVAELWSNMGYTVELTQQSKDGGVDIIVINDNLIRSKFLIECKRPDPLTKIGVKPVRELYGLLTHTKATKAILATTASFTKGAQLFMEANKWELEGHDYDKLMRMIRQYSLKK